MIIDQELIARYHRNQCSPQEAAAVEDWLFSEGTEEALSLPEGADKAAHKAQMWAAIANQIPVQTSEKQVLQKSKYQWSTWPLAVAACLFLLLSGSYFYFNSASLKESKNVSEQVYHSNDSGIQVNGLQVLLGDKSKASFNPSSNTDEGTIAFCGMILINPEKDIKLTLHAQCLTATDDSKIQDLKKGQRYIAFNYKFKSANEVILVNEKNLMNLPPVLQREIMKQFNI